MQGGVFTTSDMTEHTRTNTAIIKRFLDVEISCEQLARKLWEIRIQI